MEGDQGPWRATEFLLVFSLLLAGQIVTGFQARAIRVTLLSLDVFSTCLHDEMASNGSRNDVRKALTLNFFFRTLFVMLESSSTCSSKRCCSAFSITSVSG